MRPAAPLPPIYIADRPDTDFSELVTDFSVSLTMDQTSQVSITLIDRGLERLRANYFQPRQPIAFLGMRFEISAVDVQQGQGVPQVTLACRPAATQVLKRDKRKAVLGNLSATQYAAEKAREVGLAFFGENAPPKANVSQGSGDQVDESAWDVLKRLASDNSFMCFETDGRLFFCSEAFLLGKFAVLGYGHNPGFLSLPVAYESVSLVGGDPYQFDAPISGPPDRPTLSRQGADQRATGYLQEVLVRRAGQTITDDPGIYASSTVNAVQNLQAFTGLSPTGIVDTMTWTVVDSLATGVRFNIPNPGYYYVTPLGVPTLHKSDDATDGATAAFQLEREQGKLLRPGMTINILNVPGFEQHYLVSEVSWREGTADAVAVSARTLIEPKPTSDGKNEELNRFRAALSMTGGGFANTTLPLGTFGGN